MILNPEDRKERQGLKNSKRQNRRAQRMGISNIDMCMIRESAKKQAKKMEKEAEEKAFLRMLAIPLNVLVNDYWPKTAKKKAQKFIEDVLSLCEAVECGVVTDEQLAELLEDMAGVKIEAEWIKRGVEDETSSTV